MGRSGNKWEKVDVKETDGCDNREYKEQNKEEVGLNKVRIRTRI